MNEFNAYSIKFAILLGIFISSIYLAQSNTMFGMIGALVIMVLALMIL